MNKLLKFAMDTKDINPNLLKDVKNGFIKPSKMIDKIINKHNNKKDTK